MRAVAAFYTAALLVCCVVLQVLPAIMAGEEQQGEPLQASPPAADAAGAAGTASAQKNGPASSATPKLGSGRPALTVKKRKQAVRMITCDVCRLVVADFYDRGLEDEEAFDEYGNQVCDPRRQQGLDLWASVDVERTDTDVWTPSGVNSMDAATDRGGGLRVKDMRPASQYCGDECLMAARACDLVISEHVGDLAEQLLYGAKMTKETLVEKVCGKGGWTRACSKHKTTPPEGFRYDEDLPFVPLNEEERLYVEKITHYRWCVLLSARLFDCLCRTGTF